MPGQLKDSFGREINYLRVSVTDRCNFRCFYCMPKDGVSYIPPENLLTYEEIYKIIKVAVKLGIKKIRFTGGEPLIRQDFLSLVKMTKTIFGLEKISLTTNGVGLLRYANELRIAGIDSVNISLNSLNPKIFKEITQGGIIGEVLDGIQEALRAGFESVKINMVYLKDINDKEIIDFLELTKNPQIIVRFIELMPKGEARKIWVKHFAPIKELREKLIQKGLLTQEEEINDIGKGPSRYYLTPWGGKVGLIGLLSDHYCESCNRLRLTSDGKLYPCLMNEDYLPLKSRLNQKSEDKLIEEAIIEAVKRKSLGANLQDPEFMNRIGG